MSFYIKCYGFNIAINYMERTIDKEWTVKTIKLFLKTLKDHAAYSDIEDFKNKMMKSCYVPESKSGLIRYKKFFELLEEV